MSFSKKYNAREVDQDVIAINHLPEQFLDWYCVVNHQGIIAYFGSHKDALRFRLDYINHILNTI